MIHPNSCSDLGRRNGGDLEKQQMRDSRSILEVLLSYFPIFIVKKKNQLLILYQSYLIFWFPWEKNCVKIKTVSGFRGFIIDYYFKKFYRELSKILTR